MKNVAFVVGPALGHAGRAYSIAQELARLDGARACFLTTSAAQFLPELAHGHFEIVALPEGTGAERLPDISYADALEQELVQRRFDVVVLDLDPLRWLSVLRRPQCPVAFVTNVFLTAAAQLETLQATRFAKRRARIDDVRRQRGLQPLASVFDLYEADRVLLADPSPIASRFAPFPENYRTCGACFWSRPGELPRELEDVHDALLISMGSTGREPIRPGLLRQLIGEGGCKSVICVGTALPALEGVEIPIYRYPALPLDLVLARSKIVLCHGGAGSSYQALAAGVPVVVLPTSANHALLAEILEALKVGVYLRDPSMLPAGSLEGLDTLGKNARSFAVKMCEQNGARSSAAEIIGMASC